LLHILNNQQEIFLDIGSGAGLPGIPLAIVLERNQFILLDSKQKKVNFLQHVITSLELKNVTVVNSKVEIYKSDLNFTAICSRAFAKVETFVNLTSRFCISKEARVIAMQADKDKYQDLVLPQGFYVDKLDIIDLPGVDVKRCLVSIKRGESG
jgi:16S rRNA (guanine527-N7)-methyltransferase